MVTGEQGGKLMACFLYKIHEDWEHASQDDNGIFSDAVPQREDVAGEAAATLRPPPGAEEEPACHVLGVHVGPCAAQDE